MESMFSEFSYGYALTEEIASGKLGPLIGCPIFPSLRSEGNIGGGYDVKIPLVGMPLFLQFKLSHYLSRSNAKEWRDFSRPYYRFYLRPSKYSIQHKLLIDLSHIHEVYYAAPEFHKNSELSDAYINHQVFEKTAFLDPKDIGYLPDDNLHYIVFCKYNKWAYLHSDDIQRVGPLIFGKTFWETQSLKINDRKTKIDENFFENLTLGMISMIKNNTYEFHQLQVLQTEAQNKGRNLREKAQFLAYISRVYFDAELFIVGNSADIAKHELN
ncbi:MAG: hypothetical protein AAC993_04860 [Dehalococcoides mccartyi]|uniref:hypothetical protein n=1 Tax=Dehalococcoides mccartyi TaxID=61435 RepID=UPI0030F98675